MLCVSLVNCCTAAVLKWLQGHSKSLLLVLFDRPHVFGWQFVKRFALCYRTVVSCPVCPVCDIGVLRPNSWTDQDETWHAGSLGPGRVRLGPRSPSQKGHSPPQFSAYICCGKMAQWIKMPLGRKVGLDPSDIVLDGDPAPLSKNGAEPPIFGSCLLCPNGWMD